MHLKFTIDYLAEVVLLNMYVQHDISNSYRMGKSAI